MDQDFRPGFDRARLLGLDECAARIDLDEVVRATIVEGVALIRSLVVDGLPWRVGDVAHEAGGDETAGHAVGETRTLAEIFLLREARLARLDAGVLCLLRGRGIRLRRARAQRGTQDDGGDRRMSAKR